MEKEIIIALKGKEIEPSLPQVCCYCLAPSVGSVTVENKYTRRWEPWEGGIWEGNIKKYEVKYRATLAFPYCEEHLREARRCFKFFRIVRFFAIFLGVLVGALILGGLFNAMYELVEDDITGCCGAVILVLAFGPGYLTYRLALRAAKAIGVRYLWPEESFRDVDPIGGTLGVLSRIEGDGLVYLRLAFTNKKYTDLMVKSGFSCRAAT